MSLKSCWEDERQQRQQAVQGLLTQAREARLTQAADLRDRLQAFRDQLQQDDDLRRLDFQELQADLQQFRADLRADSQTFLEATGDRRLAMAAQLREDLAAFRENLQDAVALLREELQTGIAERQAATQEFLSEQQQHRLLMQVQTVKELAEFVEALQVDVQILLAEARSQREQQAIDLRQQLTADRQELTETVQAFFDQQANFREELRQFRANLTQQVWGDQAPAAAAPPPPKPTARPPRPAAKNGKAPTPPAAKSTNGKTSGKVPAPPAKAPAETKAPADAIAYEREVYNHIHQTHGARLTEIESALGINRFQAVDALRSLIKKGLITQQDRVYLASEDLTPTRG